MLAAQIKERLEEEARKRSANWRTVETTEKAALLLNISPRSISRAAQLLRSGDQRIILLVQKGEMAVSAAAEKPDLPIASSGIILSLLSVTIGVYRSLYD